MKKCLLPVLVVGVVLAAGDTASGGRNELKLTMEKHERGTVPVFRWDACEETNLKNCKGKKAVTDLVVGVGLSCTFMPNASNLARALAKDALDPRRHLWQIQAAPGETLKPPIVYGIVPKGAVQNWPPEGKPPPIIPTDCEYDTFVMDGADMVEAVQKQLAKMEKPGEDPFAGADAPGTHAVQKLAGKQECFFGTSKMVLANGVEMNVPTLLRRATDGLTVVEDSVSISAGQKPARTAYRFAGAEGGTFTLTQVGGPATGTGTFVAGPDHWQSWTQEIVFGGAGTSVKGTVTRNGGALVTKGGITAGGKVIMTYGGTFGGLAAAECEKLFSRIPPLPGL
jgi:hypothetical protein